MFGTRRRRNSSNPPPHGSIANPNAATAAAQAFLKNQASNASLSSAAAAAALRSRPTTPTSVADVQTKRTLRRTGSASSMASSVAGSVAASRPSLQRRGSSGSMTERTFRDQSPSRAVPSAPDAPPVPSIPKNLPAIPQKSHRRAASMEAPPMRVASPPPNLATGRGSSLGPRPTAQPKKAGQRISNLSSVQELTGVERPESRGSVNFSYPTGSRPTSPTITQRRLTSPSPSRANPPRITSPNNQNMIYDANSRRFVPAHQFYAMEYAADQRIQDAANKPVKKKKKIAPQQYEGTHLADGTVGGRPKGTAVDEMEAAAAAAAAAEPPKQVRQVPLPTPVSTPAVPVESKATTPKKKKKMTAVGSGSESDQASTPGSSVGEMDVQPTVFNTRAGALLAKKPSVVREDPEDEEETPKATKPGLSAINTGTPGETRPISPTPLPRSAAGRGHGRGQAAASAAFAEERQQTRSSSQPAPVSPSPSTPASGLTPKNSVRVQSVSPSRTTHFATTPDSLVVKHHPPPRSISPRKSALKRSNSPRGQSPADEAGSDAGHPVDSSGVSNGSGIHSDELALPRKKAVRVSFDEQNIVVGSAAAPVVTDSPVVQSPQSKKSWFSAIGRGKKKDAFAADDDETMKPRPALPSFGSVRGKKDSREPAEERALVKPAEPVVNESPSSVPSTLFTSSTGEVMELAPGQSNNQSIGSVTSQDASSKNAANISKSREPLPPQILAVESSGGSSAVGIQAPETGQGETVGDEKQPSEPDIDPSTIDRESQTPTPTGIRPGAEVPSIAVLQATPTLEHADKGEWPDIEHMPGGWNGSTTSDSGSGSDDAAAVVKHAHTDSTSPATVGIAEPIPPEIQPGAAVLGDIAAENSHPISAIVEETETESEADSSVYSDAAEDLSDGDGDGFQSLNAVVESPLVKSAALAFAISTPPESPTVRSAKEKAYRSQLTRKSSEPDLDEGWEKAQEYWKGLSAEKKRQLEQEAREEAEADEDSDSTIEATPAPKPKTKRKADVQAPSTGSLTDRNVISNERTYMIQPGSIAGPDGHAPVVPPMRSSMRAEPPSSAEDPHIRKSMRGSGAMRGSLRNDDGKGKKARPISLPPPAPKVAPTAGKTHVRNLSAASAAAASDAARRDTAPKPPVLRRKGSADSDSSFKRARKGNDASSMRQSMRGSVDERPTSPVKSSRFSIRSLSPTGSTRRQFNAPASSMSSQNHMRNSLRNSAAPAPSLRGPKPEKPGRFNGFGRSSSSKPTAKPVSKRSSSRFADSSDEEEARPAYRSRFADSDDSDDDVPAPRSGGFGAGTMRANAPVRGIPKRGGVEDGDSSDLPDSDDEKKRLGKKKQNGSADATHARDTYLATGSLRRSGSGRGTMDPTIPTANAAASSRPGNPRRGSLMSILRRKKADPGSKVRKSDAESAARRDTPLERSKSDLAIVKRQESYTSVTASSPRLQKKPPSWPLVGDAPPQIMGGEDGRPFTADAQETNGTNGDGARPDLGARRFTATGLGDVDLGLNEKPRKKKKFGALRKMFRLDD